MQLFPPGWATLHTLCIQGKLFLWSNSIHISYPIQRVHNYQVDPVTVAQEKLATPQPRHVCFDTQVDSQLAGFT